MSIPKLCVPTSDEGKARAHYVEVLDVSQRTADTDKDLVVLVAFTSGRPGSLRVTADIADLTFTNGAGAPVAGSVAVAVEQRGRLRHRVGGLAENLNFDYNRTASGPLNAGGGHGWCGASLPPYEGWGSPGGSVPPSRCL